MLRGLYTAASGIQAQTAKNDIYVANLANISSAGYRRSQVSQESFPQSLAALDNGAPIQLRGGVTVSSGGLDLTPGPITQTANDFDLTIVGSGFFCVRTPAGVAFTRNGQFQLDADSVLVNRDGYPVLGVKGIIRIASGKLKVDEQGQAWDGDKPVDALRIVDFSDGANLSKQAGSLLVGTGSRPADDYTIVQGAFEGSNVNALLELQRMMNGFRLYEANVRALQMQDDSIETLLSQALG